jgi:L-ascorbate metabolism protein UlaG (beta-lactamase superfamily)
MDIRFLGHACFELRDGDTSVVIDPFLTGNPKAAVQAADLDPTTILLTHGHADHIGDTVDIAKRSGAPVVAIVELANELAGEGVDVFDPNIGGTVKFDWGWVKLVPAWHTAVSPNGTPHMPAGLLIGVGDTTIYHLGDTALFSDLQLVARRGDKVDVALMCIGGHYTMDRIDAVTAAEFVQADTVIPCHYDTFPPIETDAEKFKSEVEAATDSQVAILQPGETQAIGIAPVRPEGA